MTESSLRQDAEQIIRHAIHAVLPDEAVARALKQAGLTGPLPGRLLLVAAGKAAWQMAAAASRLLGDALTAGVVCTKYGHVMGTLPRISCREGGHPLPDEGSFNATGAALALTHGLTDQDTVLFLLSGGGSALFEQPLIPAAQLTAINAALLASGADITQINTIRKRLSGVKGGRFALHCAPARVVSVILSDILGDPVDMIASGPTVPDSSTCAQAMAIAEKYHLPLSETACSLLQQETPKHLPGTEVYITGSVREFCAAAASACRQLGYTPVLLTDLLCCQAREAGSMMASILRTHSHDAGRHAFIMGGETVVKLTGSGKGGRNQELALAAAEGISGISRAAVISVGSDGTDGPTDAAGGYVDGSTLGLLTDAGLTPDAVLRQNDAYHALQRTGGLIITGPTGTNVNDITIGLLG